MCLRPGGNGNGKEVLILGAGLAVMAAAYNLNKLGYRCVILGAGGPSRMPHHHGLTLRCCKELKVPIQIYDNVNENAYYFADGKGPLPNKRWGSGGSQR